MRLTVLMGITVELTWFWARSCDSGFLILEKAGGSFPSSCGTSFPAPQAICQLPDLRGGSSILGSPDLLWCLGSNPAQPRSQALTLPIHPCNQSLLLELVGRFWVWNRDSNSWPTEGLSKVSHSLKCPCTPGILLFPKPSVSGDLQGQKTYP